jgi:hypothetical protein
MTRKTDGVSGIFEEQAPLTQIKIGIFQYFIKECEIKGRPGLIKNYLVKKRNNMEPFETPWICEKTKNLRYVWRGDIDIDKKDVLGLLKFLLTKREGDNKCPSILINAGSHGENSGKNANSTGDFTLAEIRIYDEMVDLVVELL